MRGTVSFLNRFWKDQSGATLTQFVIIVAIVGMALASSMILLSGSISQAINGF